MDEYTMTYSMHTRLYLHSINTKPHSAGIHIHVYKARCTPSHQCKSMYRVQIRFLKAHQHAKASQTQPHIELRVTPKYRIACYTTDTNCTYTTDDTSMHINSVPPPIWATAMPYVCTTSRGRLDVSLFVDWPGELLPVLLAAGGALTVPPLETLETNSAKVFVSAGYEHHFSGTIVTNLTFGRRSGLVLLLLLLVPRSLLLHFRLHGIDNGCRLLRLPAKLLVRCPKLALHRLKLEFEEVKGSPFLAEPGRIHSGVGKHRRSPLACLISN
mmetsp:Transcript_41986/g.104830  ORF Transcript_41986/g.104830 Transcript_41986/m.104830 type:complete len:270 (+) Transcript_41986:284-1093(+)